MKRDALRTRRRRLFNRKIDALVTFSMKASPHSGQCRFALNVPDRDPAEVYKKGRREMRRASDTELLKVPSTGNEREKELAQEELQHREHDNVQRDRRIAKWTVVVSIVALVVSIIAIVVSVH